MIKELSTHDVAHELSSNKDNGFSYRGARALAEYLEQYEEETGEKIELDTVALRCEYSEYETALEAYSDYNTGTLDIDGDEEEMEEQALLWLEERTQVITFDGGIIIQEF